MCAGSSLPCSPGSVAVHDTWTQSSSLFLLQPLRCRHTTGAPTPPHSDGATTRPGKQLPRQVTVMFRNVPANAITVELWCLHFLAGSRAGLWAQFNVKKNFHKLKTLAWGVLPFPGSCGLWEAVQWQTRPPHGPSAARSHQGHFATGSNGGRIGAREVTSPLKPYCLRTAGTMQCKWTKGNRQLVFFIYTYVHT